MRRRSRQDRYGWRSDLRAYDPASSSPSGCVEQLHSASESKPLSTRIGSFVLAYVPEVALYDVQVGDHLRISVGLATYTGYVSQSYDLAGQLPKEFQQTFQPVNRARLIRVEFDRDQRDPPSLFARAKLSAAGWPSDWLR